MQFRFQILLVLALISASLSSFARAQDNEPAPLFKLADERLREISGLAVSPHNDGIFWMHNDSGDSARVFAVDSQGQVAATVNLEGVEARDFEDMALAGGWIYLADCGDNFEVRENITVYRFREPKIAPDSKNQEITLQKSGFEKMVLQFPDGPHNCESLAATPDGRLLFVTKSQKQSGFYALESAFQNGTSGALRKIGTFEFGKAGFFTKMATGADFSPDGRKLTVTTYAQIYQFPLDSPFDFSTLKLQPQIWDLPPLKQCESVAFLADNCSLVVISEGKNQPLYVLNEK